MKFDRIGNTFRNGKWGIGFKIITQIFPFAVKTALIYSLGIEYLGLNSIFTSIISILSLAEMGFSSAITYSMYRPVAEDDNQKICNLLAYYKKIYRIVGVIILLFGSLIVPFLPSIIRSDVPVELDIYILYSIHITEVVVSYWLFAYKNVLFVAFQRNDLVYKIGIAINIAKYLLQIGMLIVTKNYYAFIITYPIFSVLSNLVTQVVSKKIFPGLSCNGKLDLVERRKIRKNVYGLLIQKIGETTRNSFDSIVLSSLFGLVIVGIYSNYYFVMNSVIGFMAILLHSIIPIVGNSVATEDIEKNFNDFEYIHFGYMTIACVATSCLICLYQPFMDIWVGGKDLLFPFEIVIAFAVYFYLLKIGDIPAIYYSAAGLWWYGRYRYIIEAIINIILNIILGKIFGPIGIVLATIISIIGFSYWYSTYLIFKYYFGFEKIKSFLVKNVYYTLITITSSVLSYLGCNSIGLYKEQEYSIILFFAGALICSGISLSIIFIIFRNSKEFIQLKLKILGGMSNGINV